MNEIKMIPKYNWKNQYYNLLIRRFPKGYIIHIDGVEKIYMERIYKFKVNTINKKFKEVWRYCKTFNQAYKLRQFGIDNGLISIILEFKNGKWHHV